MLELSPFWFSKREVSDSSMRSARTPASQKQFRIPASDFNYKGPLQMTKFGTSKQRVNFFDSWKLTFGRNERFPAEYR